ncbi:hypothetical protein GOQ27_16910 [Clostridium sp. D2Q-11]|uniref:Uncharacterized protein n=1 Tax=Anaeromonas frigoriresistens TaxID=2683708 RepID=A0A942V2Y6_9FIRM|nr:hypothetical protein [Anaeromonas frigoriresistens]MBS4540162.1 hypothetical protein [Anaeromonas frigoriresistens]
MDINKNELKNSLKSASKNQNSVIIKLSFLEILYRKKLTNKYESDINRILDTLGLKGENIKEIKHKMIDKIDKIDIIYEENLVDENIGLEYFKNIRNDIHNILIDLSRYLTEISYYNNIYYDIISRSEFDSNIRINFEEFYKEIYSFLMKDETLLNQKISEIVWTIPIKISKKKYYDIIENSFKYSFKNSSKKKVDILFKRFKSIFNGTLEWGYVDSFDKYFRLSQYYKDIDYKKLSTQELEKEYISSGEVIKEIEILLDYIRELGMITNKFIIINILKNNMSSSEKKDITKFINEINKNSEETLKDRIDTMEKLLISSTKEYQDITKDIINSNINIDDDLQSLYSTTEKVIGYLKDYFIESEELIFSKDEIVDQSYLNKTIDNFIQFIERNVRNMDNVNRKIRMKKILSLLDTPFRTPDEFFDYLKSSIEFNNDKEEIKYIFNEIYTIISNYKERP